MYKYLILFLTIIFTNNIQSQYVWDEIYSVGHGRLLRSDALDSANLILFTKDYGENIYISSNGGYDWKLVYWKKLIGGDTSTVLDITYADTNEFYALYHKSKIIKYDCNGTPLDTIYLNLNDRSTHSLGYDRIKMKNKNEGALSYNNQLLVTEDAWKTYKIFNNFGKSTDQFRTFFYNNKDNFGCFFHPIHTLVYTRDGGESFQEYDFTKLIKEGIIYDDIWFVNDSIAYLRSYVTGDSIGEPYVGRGSYYYDYEIYHQMYKTTTGGSEWFKVLDTALAIVYPIDGCFMSMSNENEGMYFNDKGILVTTSDGFKTIRVEQIDRATRSYQTCYINYSGNRPLVYISTNNASLCGIYSWRDTLGLLPPKLNLPLNESNTTSNVISLSWKKDEGIRKYIVQVASDKEFSHILRNDTLEATSMSPVSNSIAISGLEHCKTYYWRVASNKEVYYKWSETRSFTKILPFVRLFSPTDYAKITENKVELNWYVLEGAEYYHLQCAYDSQFEHIFYSTETLTKTHFELSDLPEDTVLYWRVSANCKDIEDFHWSNTWQFRTPKSTSIGSISNNFKILFPNPANDFINITIDNDTNLLAREVQILDLLGLTVSNSELINGNNRIDISNLARGTYFIKVGGRVERFVKM